MTVPINILISDESRDIPPHRIIPEIIATIETGILW
jgi:hypothetical protein